MEQLSLPYEIVGQADVRRLLRELTAIDDFLASAAVRQPGTSMQVPKTTRLLEQISKDNELDLLQQIHRRNLKQKLEELLERAPRLHISFASEPSPKVLEKILIWMRENIHPQTLLQVGLQPTIAAGCVLRTPNKIFDMSLRTHLKDQAHYLTELIAGTVNGR